MKKLFLMLACSSMCIMGMNAQEKLVKEVEKEIGAAKYATLSEKLKPAFTDATSEKDAYTWFVAAKVEMNEFDELFKQKMIGKSVDATVLGKHLLAGIDYLKKVLPLDTVPEVDKIFFAFRFPIRLAGRILSQKAQSIIHHGIQA